MHHKDLEELLEHHALRSLPRRGTFYLVAYDRGAVEVNPEDAVDEVIGFRELKHANACASALACGNMPRVVLRCEPVAYATSHEPSVPRVEYTGAYRRMN